MAKDSQMKEKKKRFTTREMILLISLLVVAVVYGYANFFFLPTVDKINQLETENNTLQLEYDSQISLIAQKTVLQDQLEENNRLYNEYKAQYYKTTNQEHFIKVLEVDLFEKNDLDIASISFNQALPLIEFNSSEASVISLHSSIATFPYEGSYKGLVELIRRLEKSKQLIRINSLDIFQVQEAANGTTVAVPQTANAQEIIYQGNISIEFFIIPQEYSFPWNVGVPQYDKASAFSGSLFYYDDGGIVRPAPVIVAPSQPVVNNPNEVPNSNNPVIQNPVVPSVPVIPTNPVTPANPVEDEDDEDDDITPGTYVVQPGDTLWGISMRFYGTNNYVDQIMFLNNISDTRQFRSGTTINLPIKK